MVIDPVSNLIIKIKNAGIAKQSEIAFPYSKFIESVLVLLEKQGFVKSFEKKGKKVIKSFDIGIAYEEDGTPKVSHAKRISKLSKRIYKGSSELRPVRNNYGLLVLSTSKGVMSSFEAKKQKVGGEALFEIW